MPDLTREEAAKIGLEAEKLCLELLAEMNERKVQREVAITALQMLLAHVAVQMGVGFMDLMGTLAKNMPTFYKKQFSNQPGGVAPVLDLSEFRKGGEPQEN